MENWEFAQSVSPKPQKFSEKTDIKSYFPVGSKQWMTTGFPSSEYALVTRYQREHTNQQRDRAIRHRLLRVQASQRAAKPRVPHARRTAAARRQSEVSPQRRTPRARAARASQQHFIHQPDRENANARRPAPRYQLGQPAQGAGLQAVLHRLQFGEKRLFVFPNRQPAKSE